MKSRIGTITVGTLAIVLVAAAMAEAGGRRRSGGSSGGTTTASQAESPEAYAGPVNEVEEALVKAINAERARHGLRALALDRLTHLKARRHCAWMARNRSMVHGVDGAENIAMGQPNVAAAVATWMASPGHRANILNPGYTRTGVAGFQAEGGTIFWCQQFN